jgi:hypothetical protein
MSGDADMYADRIAGHGLARPRPHQARANDSQRPCAHTRRVFWIEGRNKSALPDLKVRPTY